MDSFDIGRLTDFDFESVCKDLFEEILGVKLEIFAPGPDQGVDLRHLKRKSSNATIIQCKHWIRSSRSTLLSHMRTKEKPKIHRLSPSRYILATSAELTKQSKDTLVKDLAPFISANDIYGLQEIESELRKRPDIVRRHLRLWLSSATVLQSLLAKEILIRSHSLVDDISRSLKFYAPNASYERAQQLLESKNVAVISGLPGIGKTTLAHALVAYYISQGFEPVEISEDVEEANRLWENDKKQIFYYDDFLGQTTLDDKLNKNEDSRLIGLLGRVRSSPNKRFLLTTREYILNQARQRYEKISSTDFNPMTCVLDLSDYTRLIRAQILYNNVYFSELPCEYKAAFADPEAYLPIINHANFNPRLIRLSLEQFATYETPDETPKNVLMNLQKPRRLWGHIIDHQLNRPEVSVLETLFSLGAEAPLEAVKQSWLGYAPDGVASEDFRRSLQIMEGTLVRIDFKANRRLVGFHNPSVRDYMREHLSSRPERITNLVTSAIFFEQLQTLWTIGMGFRGETIMSTLLEN
ncbi:restriction endonuclease, partial [Actinocorallia aurantiaca]|uniref:nSTAND3 domain-containing NTPase n=1 Tax=Actinocorallia aurantiaca TaxID=46204 RepID=UPI0031E39206